MKGQREGWLGLDDMHAPFMGVVPLHYWPVIYMLMISQRLG
jgi:hypothetical protein